MRHLLIGVTAVAALLISAPGFGHNRLAPFGFGYRRCPGEQLTIEVFADAPSVAWQDHLPEAQPSQSGKGPVGPNAVIDDDIGFTRPA